MIKSGEIKGVSVLLPTITIDDWLDQAVNSLLSQQGLEYEIIVTYDGIQPDPQRPWFHDSRVVCVHIPKRSGLANALNMGSRAASYSYLARLDSDDVSMTSRLAVQAKYLDDHSDVVLVGSSAFRIDENGTVHGCFGRVGPGDVRRLLLRRNVLIHSSVMFRADKFRQTGGYDSRIRLWDDYDLWLRLSAEGELHVLDEPMVKYRIHPKQMSRGAAPWRNYRLLAHRRQLSRSIHESSVNQFRYDILWLGAQVLLYFGLRKPRYALGE